MLSTKLPLWPALQEQVNELAVVLGQGTEEHDALATFPTEAMDAIRKTPLMGLLVPEQHGGLGGSLSDVAKVASTLASGCLVTAFIWSMHCQQVDALVRYGSPELAAQTLPRVAQGDLYLASVTTEPQKGGRLLVSDYPATIGPQGLRFEREAPVVTGARHADAFLITLRASESAPRDSLTLIFAERHQLEITELAALDMVGMRASENMSVSLRGEVPRHQVVGTEGQFRQIGIDSMIPAGHIGWAASWLGAARAATSRVVHHLRRSTPRPGDQSFDLKAVRLARLRTQLELAETYLASVALEVDDLRSDGSSVESAATQIHLNTLKVVASEICYSTANELIDLVGFTAGYTRGGLGLDRLLRDLRSASLNNSNERLLAATGRLVLMDPLTTTSGATSLRHRERGPQWKAT